MPYSRSAAWLAALLLAAGCSGAHQPDSMVAAAPSASPAPTGTPSPATDAPTILSNTRDLGLREKSASGHVVSDVHTPTQSLHFEGTAALQFSPEPGLDMDVTITRSDGSTEHALFREILDGRWENLNGRGWTHSPNVTKFGAIFDTLAKAQFDKATAEDLQGVPAWSIPTQANGAQYTMHVRRSDDQLLGIDISTQAGRVAFLFTSWGDLPQLTPPI